MPHSVPLITTIAAAFGLALVLGFLAARVKLPALAGYLLAGILIGPSTPGFVANVEIAGQLAEIGVMLLMFGVGLRFSLDDLLVSGGVNMYWNRRDKSRRGELVVGAAAGGRQCHTKSG